MKNTDPAYVVGAHPTEKVSDCEENSMSHLGNRLRELRGTHSLYEVEKGTSISRIEISRYEKGKYLPSPQNLEKLARYFEVNYSELRILHYEDLFSNPRERKIVLLWAKHQLSQQSASKEKTKSSGDNSPSIPSDKELLLEYGFQPEHIIEYPDGTAVIDVNALRHIWMSKTSSSLPDST